MCSPTIAETGLLNLAKHFSNIVIIHIVHFIEQGHHERKSLFEKALSMGMQKLNYDQKTFKWDINALLELLKNYLKLIKSQTRETKYGKKTIYV